MGFVLTLLYIAFALITPGELVPALVDYRVQLWLAVIATIASIPAIMREREARSPQLYLGLGLIVAVGLSQIANHWTGGAVLALQKFLPNIVVLYLVIINCRSILRLRVLATTLIFIGIYLVVAGASAQLLEHHESRYLLFQSTESEGQLIRIRGLGMLNDPNDLAQFLIMCIPLLALAWRKGRIIRNTMLVVVPAIILLCGIGLTHSRGGFIALAIIVFLSLRGRLGVVLTAIVSGVMFATIMALNLTGGRNISVAEGYGRIAAWGGGIGYLKSSPIFGIGFGNFWDQYGIVAHNSYIQCAAELGLFGYFFWMGLLVFTVWQLNRWAAPAVRHGGSADSVQPDKRDGESALDISAVPLAQIRKDDERNSLRRWSKIAQISLWGFLAAAYFLTRCYTLEFFLLVAVVAVVAELGREVWPPEHQASVARLTLLTIGWEIGSILFIYVSGKIMLG